VYKTYIQGIAQEKRNPSKATVYELDDLLLSSWDTLYVIQNTTIARTHLVNEPIGTFCILLLSAQWGHIKKYACRYTIFLIVRFNEDYLPCGMIHKRTQSESNVVRTNFYLEKNLRLEIIIPNIYSNTSINDFF